jgi:predicted lipase
MDIDNAIKLIQKAEAKIKETENQKARFEGEKESLLSQLEQKLGTTSIRKAKSILAEKKEELEKLEVDISKGLDEIEEMMK